MDTNIWGNIMWNVLDELVRVLDPNREVPIDRKVIDPLGNIKVVGFRIMTQDEKQKYRKILTLLLYALRYILPCVYCRESFRVYIKELPPGESDNLVEWLWKIHNCVNHKLDHKCTLGLEKFEKRLLIWTSFVDCYQVWDLLTILSLNYPKSERAKDDKEFESKRSSYFIFMYALSILLQYVPSLSSMSCFMGFDTHVLVQEEKESKPGARLETDSSFEPGTRFVESKGNRTLTWLDTSDRIYFYEWIHTQKLNWANNQNKSPAEIQSMVLSERKFISSIL